MATTNRQRIGIWIIAGALILGTFGSFAAMILAPKNQASDEAKFQELYTQYQNDLTAQSNQLSEEYYPIFAKYKERVEPFAADQVSELKTEDLVVGDGEEIKQDSDYSAYYIGWNPQGKIFDSSFDGDKLSAPLSVTANSGLIEGWMNGVVGMKIGGIRQLTIPADLAYGASGQGEDIPADTPLKFIIYMIPTPEEIAISPELEKYLTTGSF